MKRKTGWNEMVMALLLSVGWSVGYGRGVAESNEGQKVPEVIPQIEFETTTPELNGIKLSACASETEIKNYIKSILTAIPKGEKKEKTGANSYTIRELKLDQHDLDCLAAVGSDNNHFLFQELMSMIKKIEKGNEMEPFCLFNKCEGKALINGIYNTASLKSPDIEKNLEEGIQKIPVLYTVAEKLGLDKSPCIRQALYDKIEKYVSGRVKIDWPEWCRIGLRVDDAEMNALAASYFKRKKYSILMGSNNVETKSWEHQVSEIQYAFNCQMADGRSREVRKVPPGTLSYIQSLAEIASQPNQKGEESSHYALTRLLEKAGVKPK